MAGTTWRQRNRYPMFLALAQSQVAKLSGLPIPGGKIESVNSPLTKSSLDEVGMV